MESVRNAIKALFYYAASAGSLVFVLALHLFEQPHLWLHQGLDSALVTSKLGLALTLPCIAFAFVLEAGLKRLTRRPWQAQPNLVLSSLAAAMIVIALVYAAFCVNWALQAPKGFAPSQAPSVQWCLEQAGPHRNPQEISINYLEHLQAANQKRDLSRSIKGLATITMALVCLLFMLWASFVAYQSHRPLPKTAWALLIISSAFYSAADVVALSYRGQQTDILIKAFEHCRSATTSPS